MLDAGVWQAERGRSRLRMSPQDPANRQITAHQRVREGSMTPADWLYYDLLGVVVLFAADVFHLWEPWAAALTRVFERIRGRRVRR